MCAKRCLRRRALTFVAHGSCSPSRRALALAASARALQGFTTAASARSAARATALTGAHVALVRIRPDRRCPHHPRLRCQLAP